MPMNRSQVVWLWDKEVREEVRLTPDFFVMIMLIKRSPKWSTPNEHTTPYCGKLHELEILTHLSHFITVKTAEKGAL